MIDTGTHYNVTNDTGEWDSALGCFVPIVILGVTLLSFIGFSLRLLSGFLPAM